MVLGAKKKRNKIYTISFWFIVFCFFPYIRILPINTDSQPNALLIGLIYLLLIKGKFLNPDKLQSLSLFLVSLIILFYSPFDFNSIRSVLSYLSLFVITTTTYNLLISERTTLSFAFLRNVIVIWFIVGVIQQFINEHFGLELISRNLQSSNISSGRGVISLAPEPTFYAIICVLLSIIAFLNFRHHPQYRLVQLLLLIQIFLLSRSSTIILSGALSLILFLIIKAIIQKPIRLIWICFVVVISLISLKVVLPHLSHLRLGILLNTFFQNPHLFILADESVNERFIHAYMSIVGFIRNLGLPHTYDDFDSFIRAAYYSDEYGLLFLKEMRATRIMSGIGSMLFELGVLVIPYLLVLYRAFTKLIKNDINSLFFIIMFCMIFFNAMPISNALFGFVVGDILYAAKSIKTKQANQIKHSYL